LERKYDELVRAKAKSVLVGNDADKWRSELEEAMGNELKWKNRYIKLKSSKIFFFGAYFRVWEVFRGVAKQVV
jgi:hypothetical protein